MTHRSPPKPRDPDLAADASGVVLLHGMGSTGEDWPLQIDSLRPIYHIHAPDLLGHGRSPEIQGWPRIEDFAADVALRVGGFAGSRTHEGSRSLKRAFHLVGLSLGGLVALQMALDSPETVRSLTLVNAFAHFQRPTIPFRRQAGRIFSLAFGRMDRMAEIVADGLFPRPNQAQLRLLAVERLSANRRSTYLRSLAAVARFDVRGRLAEIRAPTLVVAGADDDTVPPAAKLELADGITGARLEIVPNSGHATPLDSPEAFNQLLLEFLREVDGELQT